MVANVYNKSPGAGRAAPIINGGMPTFTSWNQFLVWPGNIAMLAGFLQGQVNRLGWYYCGYQDLPFVNPDKQIFPSDITQATLNQFFIQGNF